MSEQLKTRMLDNPIIGDAIVTAEGYEQKLEGCNLGTLSIALGEGCHEGIGVETWRGRVKNAKRVIPWELNQPVDPRDAELATLRQKLATAEAELKKCGEAVMTYVEAIKRKNREIWAAEADCAAMREALFGIGEYWNGAEGSAVDACEEARARVDAALTRPTGQAILNELSAARKVCEAAQMLVSHCLSGSMRRDAITDCESAVIEYRAAYKANTGANNGKL